MTGTAENSRNVMPCPGAALSTDDNLWPTKAMVHMSDSPGGRSSISRLEVLELIVTYQGFIDQPEYALEEAWSAKLE